MNSLEPRDMQEIAAAMVKQFRQVAQEIGLSSDLQKDSHHGFDRREGDRRA